MPLVSPVPYVPYRAFDDDGDPLAGGLFYAYAAGTDTPLSTYHDPAGTTLNPHPVALDDAGYAPIYLLSGAVYKLRLTDAMGVQQWLVDGVRAPGAGGAFTTAPLTLQAVPGVAPLVAAGVWQPDWRQIGATIEVTQAFGTSAGLTHLAIGDLDQFDRWGLAALALGTRTRARDFRSGHSPWTPALADVLVTPVGGSFDSTGQLRLTLHYLVLD